MSSIFSKIIAREIPAHIVYESDQVIAFLDIHPVAPGHTLVVPKHEQLNALESTASDLAACWEVIQKLTPGLLKIVGAQGCNISTNVGETAGQSVPHTHFHVIPRQAGDELVMWPGHDQSQEELAELAQRIRENV